MTSLETLLSFDPEGDLRDPLERFLAQALFDAAVWSSPRTSDGVVSYRIVERVPARLRVCGRIWEIDQTLHSFWLDVTRAQTVPDRTTWTLYFDSDATSIGNRRARNALEAIEGPGDVTWVATLEGSE